MNRLDLDRFLTAQDRAGTYDRALAELRSGAKTTHWMWFVFPQVAGLGSSPTSVMYAISGVREARAYLAHPVLGRRLFQCAETLLALPDLPAGEIFGPLDALKLRSSMTLFAIAAPEHPIFSLVIERYFDGEWDPVTERILAAEG